MLRDDPAAGRNEWRYCLQRGREQPRLGVWRIEDDDPEWRIASGVGATQPRDGLCPDDATAVGDVGTLEVRRDHPGRSPIPFDEGRPSRAAGEGFDPRGAGTCEQVEHVASGQIRLEDREQRLLDAVPERPCPGAGRHEADAPSGAGDHPTAVAGGHAPLAGSPAATRRSHPSSSSWLRAGRGGSSRPAGSSSRSAWARARTASSRCSATWSDATRSRGKPLWASPRTSPSLRSSKSFSASAKPSRVSATAWSRAWATSSVESDTRTQNDSIDPRPTRPRSWCSWASPNRSAPSMTIIV